ncbi:hypothetical protein Y032_0189g1227 [Ancylostoma ceylanicum]|uniref:Uncharacterized protein n=1 Tax=Ancylostoma ceylanicum TaxID=53326 RepID=A0A016SQQ1_9BILA|nr:hypothetical protein Y032_0189g1227 [Ancylostoma ceylanicum]
MAVNKGRDRSADTLSAAPPEAAGNHDESVLLCVSAQQAHCLGAAYNQSAHAAVWPLAYGHLEFTIHPSLVNICYQPTALDPFSQKKRN